MRILIIGNPIAGRGRSLTRMNQLAEMMQQRGHQVDLYRTQSAGDASRRASQIRFDNAETVPDRLVVAGGDGTLNEVVNGLADPTRVPILPLPMGTANLLVRELKLPWSVRGVAEQLLSDQVQHIPLATIGSRRFILLASMGFDSLVVHEIAQRRKSGLGFLGYMSPVLRCLRRYRPPTLRVTVDDQPPVVGAMALVGLVRCYAGFFQIADRIQPGQDHLDVVVLSKGSPMSLMSYAWSAWRGKLSQRSDMIYLTGKRVSLESDQSWPIEVDGDHFGLSPQIIQWSGLRLPIVAASDSL